jgi:cytochrome c-type biogenesis protein CcmH/NrfG
VFAAATGMSTEEARTALAQFRDRVAAVRENPDQVAAEARTFLAQYADRAQQQALKAAAAVQEGATVSAWVTFGVLVLTLVVAILGALAGIPSLRTWRMRWTHTGAA